MAPLRGLHLVILLLSVALVVSAALTEVKDGEVRDLEGPQRSPKDLETSESAYYYGYGYPVYGYGYPYYGYYPYSYYGYPYPFVYGR